MREISQYSALPNKREQILSSAFPWFSFDIYQLFDEIRQNRFPTLAKTSVRFFIEEIKHLAFISTKSEEGQADIVVHEILNNPKTPRYVMSFILSHELLHLIVKPREIDGKIVGHPPEFFEEEKKLCPEREEAWTWIYIRYSFVIKRDTKKECMTVKKKWKMYRYP